MFKIKGFKRQLKFLEIKQQQKNEFPNTKNQYNRFFQLPHPWPGTIKR